MTAQPPYDVLIIGSGMAGLAAVEAARAMGFTFNHGAQFLTARHPDFIAACTGATDSGALAPPGRLPDEAPCAAP